MTKFERRVKKVICLQKCEFNFFYSSRNGYYLTGDLAIAITFRKFNQSIFSLQMEDFFAKNDFDINLANVSAVQSLLERGVILTPLNSSLDVGSLYNFPLQAAIRKVHIAESTFRHVRIKFAFHESQEFKLAYMFLFLFPYSGQKGCQSSIRNF